MWLGFNLKLDSLQLVLRARAGDGTGRPDPRRWHGGTRFGEARREPVSLAPGWAGSCARVLVLWLRDAPCVWPWGLWVGDEPRHTLKSKPEVFFGGINPCVLGASAD